MSKSNALLGLTDLKDSAGALVSQYRMHFASPSLGFSAIIPIVSELIASFLMNGFWFISTLAARLFGFVTDPSSWLEPLQRSFQSVLTPIYETVPPLVIAGTALGILAFMILVPRSTSMSPKFGSEEAQRLGIGLIMVMVISVIMANPFKLLLDLFNKLLGIIGELIPQASMATELSTSATVDAFIRQATILVNYQKDMSAECTTAWSQVMSGELSGYGFSGMGCVSPDEATAGPVTVILAFVALGVACMFLVFATMAAWKFLAHVVVCGALIMSMVYVLAVSIAKRRAFDFPARVAASALGHFIVAVAVFFLAALFPLLTMSFMDELPDSTPGLAYLLLNGVGYILGGAAIWMVSRKRGKLVQMLRADITDSLNNYLGVSDSITNKMDVNQHVNSLKHQLSSWSSALNEQARLSRMYDQRMGNSITHVGKDGKVVSEVLPDRPETELTRQITAGYLPSSHAPDTTIIMTTSNRVDKEHDTGTPRAEDEAGGDQERAAGPSAIPGDPSTRKDSDTATVPAVNVQVTHSGDGATSLLDSGTSLSGSGSSRGSGPGAQGTDDSDREERFWSARGKLASMRSGQTTSIPRTESVFGHNVPILSRKGADTSASLAAAQPLGAQSPIPKSVSFKNITATAGAALAKNTGRSKSPTKLAQSLSDSSGTLFGDMMSTLNSTKRLAKARGQDIQLSLPDTDPMFGVQFVDTSERIRPYVSAGFGDLV